LNGQLEEIASTVWYTGILSNVNDLQHRAFWTQIVTEDEQNTFLNCKCLLWLNYKRLQTFHYAILFSLLHKCHMKGVMTQRWIHESTNWRLWDCMYCV